MPAVSRVGDSLSTGHICSSTTTIASSNTDGTVKANGINIIVIGAPTVSHPFPPAPPPSEEKTRGLAKEDFAKAEEQWARWWST